ncbi:MAG: ribose-5-phosphate isomerase RpiA [Deltaproteobacteria bacterium]|nr:ribose-5-phosphate isomerase RpiA [Deltaproteobacteria bacterium]
MPTQDELKEAVAQAAVKKIAHHFGTGRILGIGTGSTADKFIDALAPFKADIAGTVASSQRSAKRLQERGLRVIELNDLEGTLPVYVDGADEIDASFAMIKGGGGALTREKIVAAASDQFICIADASKLVPVLGKFPLPLEVVPMARNLIARQIRALGGDPKLRAGFITDNGNEILDVHGLSIREPIALERELNQLPGMVTVGLFAARGADVLLMSTPDGLVEKQRP